MHGQVYSIQYMHFTKFFGVSCGGCCLVTSVRIFIEPGNERVNGHRKCRSDRKLPATHLERHPAVIVANEVDSWDEHFVVIGDRQQESINALAASPRGVQRVTMTRVPLTKLSRGLRLRRSIIGIPGLRYNL